jgi:hypothetical protein
MEWYEGRQERVYLLILRIQNPVIQKIEDLRNLSSNYLDTRLNHAILKEVNATKM